MGHQALYLQFIDTIRDGLSLLEDEQQEEISVFVRQSQHQSGGFMDRGGAPDLYYSVFGSWLGKALQLDDTLTSLQKWLEKQKNEEQGNGVHRFSLLFLQLSCLQKRLSSFQLAKKLIQRDFPANFTYQLFLALLLIDASYGQKPWVRVAGRLMMAFYRLPQNVPCSVVAALTVAQSILGIKTSKLVEKVLTYFRPGSAFVAFKSMEESDLLSTGVALFALQKTGIDLRQIAPDCLEFIQQNYRKGAFLAGDDDPQADLEYTFYGLLALGSLAKGFGEVSSEQ